MMYVDYGLHTVHGLIFYLYFSNKMFNLLLFIDDVHSIYPNTTDVTWGKIISNVYICVTIVYVSIPTYAGSSRSGPVEALDCPLFCILLCQTAVRVMVG